MGMIHFYYTPKYPESQGGAIFRRGERFPALASRQQNALPQERGGQPFQERDSLYRFTISVIVSIPQIGALRNSISCFICGILC